MLAVDPDNPEHIQGLGNCYANQGELPRVWERRLPILEKAISQRKQLADRFPDVPKYRKDLATSHQALASHCVFSKHSGAEKHLDLAKGIRERLLAENPTDSELLCDYGATLRAYSEAHAFAGEDREAEPYSRRALAIHDRLYAKHPTLPRYLQHLAWDLLNLGSVLIHSGKYDEAVRIAERAATIFDGLSNDYPADQNLHRLEAEALNVKVIGLIQTGHRDIAEREFVRLEKLGGAGQISDSLARVAWHLVQREAHHNQAPAYAVELACRAIALQPEAVFAWHTMGIARYRAGQWQEAIAALKKANELEHDKGLAFNGFFLAMAFHQQGEHEQARSWYDRSVRWLADHDVKDQNAVRYRDEAATVCGVQNTKLEAKPKTVP